jgi:hypothetical protein
MTEILMLTFLPFIRIYNAANRSSYHDPRLQIRFRTKCLAATGEDAPARELEQLLSFAPRSERNPPSSGASELKLGAYVRDAVEEMSLYPAGRTPSAIRFYTMRIKLRVIDDFALIHGELSRFESLDEWEAEHESWERGMGLWLPIHRKWISVAMPTAGRAPTQALVLN